MEETSRRKLWHRMLSFSEGDMFRIMRARLGWRSLKDERLAFLLDIRERHDALQYSSGEARGNGSLLLDGVDIDAQTVGRTDALQRETRGERRSLSHVTALAANYLQPGFLPPICHLYIHQAHFKPHFTALGLFFPISQPQPLNTLTTFGVTATVSGTLMKMKLLCIAYASASCVQMPAPSCQIHLNLPPLKAQAV